MPDHHNDNDHSAEPDHLDHCDDSAGDDHDHRRQPAPAAPGPGRGNPSLYRLNAVCLRGGNSRDSTES